MLLDILSLRLSITSFSMNFWVRMPQYLAITIYLKFQHVHLACNRFSINIYWIYFQIKLYFQIKQVDFSPHFRFIAWNCIIKIDLSKKIHGAHLPLLWHFIHSYPSQAPLQQQLTSGTGFLYLSAWSELPFQIPLKTISFSFYFCYCIP